jgi:hypothetical protein
MRISTKPKDPGYAAFKAIPKRLVADVFLDGERIERVITADDRLGYVLASAGYLNTQGTDFLYKQLYGDVRIQLRPRA